MRFNEDIVVFHTDDPIITCVSMDTKKQKSKVAC